MSRLLLVGVAAVAVTAVALTLILIQHPPPGIVINAPYAFIIRQNSQWYIEWFSLNGSLHTLGPFNNLNDPDILNAMSVVDSFNQQVVPQHSSYQPLASIIVVGAGDTGKQGVVEIPVSGNTIELNQVNPGYYTLVAVPQQYANLFMEALDTGYKLSTGVSTQGLQYLQYSNLQVWKLVLEIVNLQQYAPQNVFFSERGILETNNETLIPFALFDSYGYNLKFIQQIGNFYNSCIYK